MENTNTSTTDEVCLYNAPYIADVYLMVVLSVVFLLGTTGNGLVIWFVVFKMKKTVHSVWFLSLAIADFMFSLIQPLQVTRLALDGLWPFGIFMCKLHSFITFFNMFSSVLQLTVISIDRCISVVFPVWSQNHRTTRLALTVTLGIWIISAVCSVPFFILRTLKTPADGEEYCTELWNEKTYYVNYGRLILRFIIFFVIPFIIIVSCSMVIIWRIRRNRMITSTKPFKMIAAIIISFFVCWLPYHVVFFVSIYVSVDNVYTFCVTIICLNISISLAHANSFLNPFLYVFFGRDFKEKFWSSIQYTLNRAFIEDANWGDPKRNRAQRRSSTSCAV